MRPRAAGGIATDRQLAVAVAAASSGALLVLFWPALFGRVFVYADLGNFFLPMRLYLADQLAHGITPLWMPNLFCGFYAHAEGQIGIFHPLRWLLYRFLPVTLAFNLECALPYPLALAGMALFLRRLALPASAALFGGAAFAFSSYLTLRLTHLNAVAVYAHLGWLLAAVAAFLGAPEPARTRAWLAVALITASQLLTGYPPAAVYCWMIALACALFVTERVRIAPLAALAGAIAVGVLLAGIQVVPTFDEIGRSLRASSSYGYRILLSLRLGDLLTAVAPWRAYRELELDPVERPLYFGAVTSVAAVWTCLRRRALGPWRRIATGLVLLSALALTLSFGNETPFYRYWLMLPVVGWLRAPARYTIALHVTGAVLAAIAFADLLRGAPPAETRRARRWIWAIPAASWLVAASAIALRGTAAGFPPGLDATATRLLRDPLAVWVVLAPIAFTLAAALFAAAAHGRKPALFALIALAAADQVACAAMLWWVDPPKTLAEYRAQIAPLPETALDRVDTPRLFDHFAARDGGGAWRGASSFLARGARLVSGYAGLVPAVQLDYTKAASLRVAGAGAQLVDGRFVALAGALPRARLVAHAVHSEQLARDIEAVDVATTALVEEPLELGSGRAGTAAIARDLPGAIEIAVDAPTRQLLVVSESFHPGWRAAIDGGEARVLRVNGDFLGVVVDPGVHAVSLAFAPKSFALGCWTSAAGVALVLAVAVRGLSRTPRRPADGAQV